MGFFGKEKRRFRLVTASSPSILSSKNLDSDGQIHLLGIKEMAFSTSLPSINGTDHNIGNERWKTSFEDFEMVNSPAKMFDDSSHNSSQIAMIGDSKLLKSKLEYDYTLDHVPDLILDLEYAVETGSERPIRALRMLFGLSTRRTGVTIEKTNQNRIDMVHEFNEGAKIDVLNGDSFIDCTRALVPVLLRFLTRCASNSIEQHLSLLVLNNISIPVENKQTIAVDHGGFAVLSRLLVENPSCHLLAIVLVNLTAPRVDDKSHSLMSMDADTTKMPPSLVESLVFALRVASLTREEYEARMTTIEGCDVEEITQTTTNRLTLLMAEDRRLRERPNQDQSTNEGKCLTLSPHSRLLHPQTIKWCLTTICNLTSHMENSEVADILIRSSILSLLLELVATVIDTKFAILKIVDASERRIFRSIQDTALSVILNLSQCPSSREYLADGATVKMLGDITQFPNSSLMKHFCWAGVGKLNMELFKLKARMALSFLIGSQGHFGQNHMRSIASSTIANPDNSPLVLLDVEIDLVVTLLSKSLDCPRTVQPHSLAIIDVKRVLFALRCLLTHTSNQKAISERSGYELNLLLIKALACHTLFLKTARIDKESAENACFCLYLQSNYGFEKSPFLPATLDFPPAENLGTRMEFVTTRVLSAFLALSNISPPARHAARQLLLRLRHLTFSDQSSSLSTADTAWNAELLKRVGNSSIKTLSLHGVEPFGDIFHRPIVQSEKRRDNNDNANLWRSASSCNTFSSALLAVQQLSYGSSKVRHIDSIDEIKIANDISACASGRKAESYGYLWAWADSGGLRGMNQDVNSQRQRRSSSNNSNNSLFSRLSIGSPTFLQYTCGFCAPDTTVT